MRIPSAILGVLIGAHAWAQDVDSDGQDVELRESAVFILPPNPQNPELSSRGEILTEALGRELERREDMRWVPMEAVGLIHDVPADLYARSCPVDEIVGCAYVLGDKGGADYAVATDIQRVEQGLQLQIHLVDVKLAEAAFSFQLVMEEGNSGSYGEAVAKLLHSLAIGRLGKNEDIRQGPVSSREEEIVFNESASAELQALTRELGDVSTLSQRRHGKIERPRISQEDLLGKAQTDGVKPWERLSMSAQEYVRFQNSGLALTEWRDRVRGRKSQLILRTAVGASRSWSDTSYYGQVLSAEDNLEPVETWAWQAQQSGTGLVTSLAVGFGLRPELEVGVLGGTLPGTYTVQIDRSVENQTTTIGTPFEYPAQVWYAGGYARASMLPDWSLRPAVFGAVCWWWGSRISDHDLNLPPAELPDFDPARFVVATAGPGLEARLSSAVDVVVDLPLSVHVGGSLTNDKADGIVSELDTQPVADVDQLGIGLQVGLQIRLLGKKKDTVGLDDYVD